MGVLNIGINIADSVTKSLGFQAVVTHQAWIAQTISGAPTFANAVSRHAIIDLTRKQRPTSSGKLVNTVAVVTFLEAVTANGAAGRFEPIDPRDIIVLPDGTTGPILHAPDSVIDPATGKPFFNTIFIGEISSNP